MKSNKNQLAFVILNLAIAISLGALGAHALKKVLDINSLESFKTGVLYHLLIGLVLLILHSASRFQNVTGIKLVRGILMAGMLCFCFSIYLLSTSSITGLHFGKLLGPITPIGGILIITALVILSFKIYKNDR